MGGFPKGGCPMGGHLWEAVSEEVDLLDVYFTEAITKAAGLQLF